MGISRVLDLITIAGAPQRPYFVSVLVSLANTDLNLRTRHKSVHKTLQPDPMVCSPKQNKNPLHLATCVNDTQKVSL